MARALETDPESKRDFIQALLSSERPDPYELLTRLPIDPYHHVGDVGCGPGYFSVPLAKYLSHGRLYAVDVDDEMLDALKRRVDAVPLSNVEAVKTDGADMGLAPRSLDGMLLAYVVHYPGRQGRLPEIGCSGPQALRLVLRPGVVQSRNGARPAP